MDKTAPCSSRRGSTPSSSLAPPSPLRATGNRPSCRSSSSCPPRRREATRPSSCGAPAGGRRGRPTTWRRFGIAAARRAYLIASVSCDLDTVARTPLARRRHCGRRSRLHASRVGLRRRRDAALQPPLLRAARIRVSINPESKSRAVNREVLSELIKVHDKTSLGSKLPAYDGRKSLYTAGSLPFESEEFSVTLVDAENKDKERAKREYNITIRIAGRTDMYHLQEFLKGRQRDMPQETIQVLDDAGLYIVMDKPGDEGAPKHQMIDCYIHTLAKVLERYPSI
ncbi:hypothetical protein ZWY2020_024963 [Hordeum vulgare]|nr:hypothetical protein ZWY2020_024963 [Hordeum vulgare]